MSKIPEKKFECLNESSHLILVKAHKKNFIEFFSRSISTLLAKRESLLEDLSAKLDGVKWLYSQTLETFEYIWSLSFAHICQANLNFYFIAPPTSS